jgi:predicted dehydrogenase
VTDRQVRFGTLGAAAITPLALVRPAKKVPEATVLAVAARDADRARSFASKQGIPRVHGSYDELLADPDVDAVYNPLPNSLHGVWTKRALAAGKHVLCEKPFTANAAEAADVAAAAAATDRVVMEAFHWRYHPMAERVLAIVRDGELGELRHVEASVCFPLLKRGDIRWRAGLAGGATLDAGCYAVNMVRAVAGSEPEVVDAIALTTGGGVDRALTGRLRFPDGATGTVTCSLLSRRVLSIGLRAKGTKGELRAFNPLMPRLFGSIRVRAGGRRRRERASRDSTYELQLRAFVAAVLDGTAFPTTVDDAVRNMTVIDQLLVAAGLQPGQPSASSSAD